MLAIIISSCGISYFPNALLLLWLWYSPYQEVRPCIPLYWVWLLTTAKGLLSLLLKGDTKIKKYKQVILVFLEPSHHALRKFKQPKKNWGPQAMPGLGFQLGQYQPASHRESHLDQGPLAPGGSPVNIMWRETSCPSQAWALSKLQIWKNK